MSAPLHRLRGVRPLTGVDDPAGADPRRAYGAAGELLKALSAPLRIEVIMLLTEHGPLCVHELVDTLAVAQPLVSQHLRVLRSAGVVVAERRGREVAYSLADEHIGRIVADAVAHVQEDR